MAEAPEGGEGRGWLRHHHISNYRKKEEKRSS